MNDSKISENILHEYHVLKSILCKMSLSKYSVLSIMLASVSPLDPQRQQHAHSGSDPTPRPLSCFTQAAHIRVT